MAWRLDEAIEHGLIDNTVPGNFKSLGEDLDEQPDDAVDPDLTAQLEALLLQAETQFLGNFPCDAADTLDTFLALCQTLRSKGSTSQNAAEMLFARGAVIQFDIINAIRNQGGCPNHPNIGMEPVPDVPAEDTDGLTLDVAFGDPKPLPTEHDGENFTELILPGTEPNTGPPGAPDIPASVHIFAAPPDATGEMTSQEIPGMEFDANLLPNIRQPIDSGGPFVDQTFGNKPFS